MKRLAVVEYLMSAGGVERVLRGLARSFLRIPEARDWDITFLLSRYGSTHALTEWPAELTGPNLHVEWIGQQHRLSRALDPLAHAQGIGGLRATRIPLYLATRAVRSAGPLWWRAQLGDPFALISQASERFDLLYFTYPFWMDVPPLKAPVVTTPQDFNFKHFLEEGSRARRIQERSTRAWLDRSDRLLLSSEAVHEELRRFYPEHEGKAEVVHLGIDVGRAPPAADDLERVRRAHALPPRFVLVTGWVMPHKNQLAVVRALSQLRSEGLELPVVFAGPNTAALAPSSPGLTRSYVDDVRDALRDAGFAAGRDYFALGYVSDADIQALYRMATVFVCPSFYEGFGLAGLEAMLAGCPVLLSAIPPFEEQNRVLGGIVPLFDPKDPATLAAALARLASDPAAARARAQAAAARLADAYDWDKTARAYLAAFHRVLEASRR
jgi:glycosyltransferase involved in cell wall biosynthesis